ncbi:MAG: hypothetical protein R2851_05670 [Caldilineaceae bacterium]
MAANNPGRTWIVGNEPDVAWQDNTTAADYACAYHDAYHAIKAGDPTAQVAISGQPGDAAAAYLSQPHLGKLSQQVRRAHARGRLDHARLRAGENWATGAWASRRASST